MGRVGERVVFVAGAYPGETVEFTPTKQKKNFWEGVASKIIVASPDRIEPIDDHFMSCSPWQTLSYDAENRWKITITQETFERLAHLTLPGLSIEAPENAVHYRNKMEYNFYIDENEVLHFAFHDRGTHHLRPIGECVLASPEINKAGAQLLNFLNMHKVPRRSLKSAIIRSDGAGHSAIALFLKDKLDVPAEELLSETNVGVQVYYSDYRSPASVPTELISSVGQNYLETNISGVSLRFGLLSFFQINPPIFTKVVEAIRPWTQDRNVVDYYSGVGAIGLALAEDTKSLKLVEENNEAVAFAEHNITANKIKHASAILARTENALEHITSRSTVIVDPPRTGLNSDVVKHLLETKPERIIYLSCGIDTQARDVALLTETYTSVFSRVYNFFPRTPHIESLLILDKKE